MKTSTPVSVQKREILHTAAKAEQDHQRETRPFLFLSTVAGKHILFVNVRLPKRLGSGGIAVRVQAFCSSVFSFKWDIAFPGVHAYFKAFLVW